MLIYQLCFSGFSLDPLDMGDVSPPRQVQETKCSYGDSQGRGDIDIMREDLDIMREDLNLIGYIKLKVLLLLLKVMQLLLL